jgi:hypothetical protein
MSVPSATGAAAYNADHRQHDHGGDPLGRRCNETDEQTAQYGETRKPPRDQRSGSMPIAAGAARELRNLARRGAPKYELKKLCTDLQ